MADDLRVAEAIAKVKALSSLNINPPIFDLYFPLPYRICAALLVGIWCWGLNVKLLTAVHVDVGHLVRYSFTKGTTDSRSNPSAPRARHQGIYQMATVLSLAVAISWLIFSLVLFVQYDELVSARHIRAIDFLPLLTLLSLLASFFIPGRQFHSAGRRRFLDILNRISVGQLDIDCRFADILVADALTSYTRVLLDLEVTLCMLIFGQSCIGKPDRFNCSGPITFIIVLSVPSLIRFRQCLIDFTRTGSNTHLINCMKYASAIPVVICGALQMIYKGIDTQNGGLNESTIYKMWVLSSLVNSIFSFIWDVTCDWGLELLATSPLTYLHSGLRKTLVTKNVSAYYLAITIDLALRMLWTMKLTTNWAGFGDYESGLFILELLEILRRAMWVFFRVEKEWIFTDGDRKGLPEIEMSEFSRVTG